MRKGARVVVSMLVFVFSVSLGLTQVQPVDARVVSFEDDPMLGSELLIDGNAEDRAEWLDSEPAFVGDGPGSLLVRYRATWDPARLGWALDESVDQDDEFIAAAAFSIRSENFFADPNGFFQISWGLWNSQTTGLDRTGGPVSIAGDTFELIEFDYFPNVTFFGGPFFSPSVFGVADEANPLFDLFGSFANASFGNASVTLPLDEVLLATIEHVPSNDIAIFTVSRISSDGAIVPIDGALTIVELSPISMRKYELDTFGITLWQDGYATEGTSLTADVEFHALSVRTGKTTRRATEVLGASIR